MKKKWAPSHWKIVEGTVDTKGEYISLTFKNNPTILALVSPGEKKTFIVEFPKMDTETTKKIRNVTDIVPDLLKNYLISTHKANAWFFAKALCTTFPQKYLPKFYHWNYHPKKEDK